MTVEEHWYNVRKGMLLERMKSQHVLMQYHFLKTNTKPQLSKLLHYRKMYGNDFFKMSRVIDQATYYGRRAR